ncbi:ATP synthase beta subunit C-terminal domain-containing protein [Pseudomonas sp. NMS19W]|uniref:ATP synthase beta subunit C-terminal domain-containing protein n=1 Tax=Pseudomonas sp. NMS19W TaxID=3079768 RepID=UPI003F65D4E1
MARKEGIRYSKCIFSGYKSQQELEEYLSRNYPQEPAEIVKAKGSNDFTVYFEDSSGEPFTITIGVEKILQDGKALQDIISILGMDELSAEDKLQIPRARNTIKLAGYVLQEVEVAVDAGPTKINIDDIIEKVLRENPFNLEPTLY